MNLQSRSMSRLLRYNVMVSKIARLNFHRIRRALKRSIFGTEAMYLEKFSQLHYNKILE